MSSKRFRKQVWYEGRVQGVGFRYKAMQIAKGYDVTGFVKNTEDGRVHVLAVGAENEVKGFVRDLNEAMRDFIRDSFEKDDETELKFKDFKIEL